MHRKLIIGFIAKDKPGLIRTISETVNSHSGNWLESKMTELAGRFVGLAVVEVDAEHFDALKEALDKIEELLSVVEETELTTEVQNTRILELNIVGPDRPGIVADVTMALEKYVANVSEMETHISAAPMSGELTFSADASIIVPFEMDWSVIAERLDQLANDLDIDIILDEEPDQ
ncbi:MAG: glycine cleavage system regulatory protein [Flavobacterium sp.]|jgi:glycine cleavage system regulatory protein